jgi:type IV pilus assembly protein PilV
MNGKIIPPVRSSLPQLTARFRQRGFNLFEVLVALLVLSFGLLGMAALQNFSMKSTHQSFQRTQATFAIQDIIDRMRANLVGVQNSNYNLPAYTSVAPASPDCSATTCTSSSDLANYDLARVITHILDPKNLGGSGEMRIIPVVGAPGLYQVGVRWAEGDIAMTQTMTVQLH